MLGRANEALVGAGREQFVACSSYEPVPEVRRVVCSTTVQLVVLPPGLEMLLVGGAWWVESHVTTFDERAVVCHHQRQRLNTEFTGLSRG